jgi:hypothetical protein
MNQRGGSEWEPIKILLEGDEDSNKTNTASNTRSHWSATEPRNQHTTFRPENAAEHQTSSPLTNTGQTGEHHQSDRSLLVKLVDFHRKAPHRLGRCNTPVRPVTTRKPQNTKQAYRPPNRPKLETVPTQDNSKLTQTFTRAKTHQGLHRSDRCSLGSSG